MSDVVNKPMVDGFARKITYLRLSVTDRCNLRCTYCMPEQMRFLPKSDVLSLEELERLANAFIARGVTRLRLTGGEPLVRRDMITLVERLGQRIGDGLEELTLTTNGTELARYADRLVKAGVRRINVSLDTLDPTRFALLTRRNVLPQVLDGIAAATAAGLQVKLNTVALKGQNDAELPDLIHWAHGQGHDITLIEVMPLGEVDEDRIAQYLPLDVVRASLEKRWTLLPSMHRTGGPARYADVVETGGRIGFITPLTSNFCAGCNRMRVTTTGQLFPCLGGGEQVDLRSAMRAKNSDEALNKAMDRALQIKPERHHFRIERAGESATQPRHMSMTGG